MNRTTTLIALLVIVGLSGCLAGGGVDSPNTSATTETSVPPTTTQSVEFPSKPAELTTEDVKAYVESYERAYRKQEIYDKYDADTTTVRSVMISTQNVSVEKRGDSAFLVTFQYMVGYTTERSGTTTAHDIRYTAQYYINSSTTMRAATTGINSSGLNPVENGTEVGGNHS